MHLRSLQLVLLLTTSIAACQSKSSTTDQATKQPQASSQVVATSPQSTTFARNFLTMKAFLRRITQLTPPNKKSFLSIGLGAPTTKTPAQEKAYNKLMGDSEFLSSSAAMQVLNPVVQRMQVSF